MSRQLRTPGDLCDALAIPFSDEQLDAIMAPLEPSVIVAGAGTGKTAVMSARVVWLVGTGEVRPEEVLGLTFTRKAAAELASRVSSGLANAGVLAGDEGEGVEQVLTYDSFAARLVSEFGLRLGIDHDPVMLTGAARFRLAARAVQAAPGPFHSISRLQHQNIPERVLELDAELQSHLVTTREAAAASLAAFEAFQQAPPSRLRKPYKDVLDALAAQAERLELLQLVDDYQELKARLGVVEYADQLRRAVELAEEVPDVARALRARHRVVLLDEYQDTSAAQARLLRGLFSGPTPREGRGFPVTAVGDPRQAIYGWRGAAADNIEDFHRMFPRADGTPARQLPLTINRRSGQAILDVGNALAEELPHADAQARLRAPDKTPPGSLSVQTFDSLDEELDWLADDLLARHQAGTPWPQIAVLVRRNATLAQTFETLRDRDIPAEIVGLGGLLHLPEITPVVATLRALDEVASNPDVAALLTSSRWQIGLADMAALGRRASAIAAQPHRVRHESLADELEATLTGTDPGEVLSLLDAIADLDDPREVPQDQRVSQEGRARMRAFADELAQLRQHVREPVADLVRRVISRLGLEVELQAAAERDASQLTRFVAAVGQYVDVDGEGSLSGLLSWLEAEDEHGVGLEQAVPTDEDSVKLLTVHRAKGLEWHTVYLPALVDKTFPAESRTAPWPRRAATLPAHLRGDAAGIPQLREFSKAGMDEYKEAVKQEHRHSEDRLAYVAVTRAKQVLIASRHAWSPARQTPDAASPYFRVIAASAGEAAEVDASPQNPRPLLENVAAWPAQLQPDALVGRLDAAAWVREAAALLGEGAGVPELEEWVWQSSTTGIIEQAILDDWDEDASILVDQHRRRTARRVELPEGLSATALMAIQQDPQRFAASLLRPMPRRPSEAAALGSRFHEWVQRRFSLPGTFDELETRPLPPGHLFTRLTRAFEDGEFGRRQPIAVEVPFMVRWQGHVLRGRIDAVYEWDGQDHDHLVVDWKTSNQPANPLQLAVYRHAWAEARGLPPERVGAAFHHVLDNRLTMVEAPSSLIDEAFGRVE